MGLGVQSSEGQGATFLAVAGGYIWDKSKDNTHPQFNTQDYKKIDDTVGVRQGARYDNLTGNVVGVRFNTHEKYGESVLVTVSSGGEKFIISIGTNNRYSQDMLKALLKMDFDKPIYINPYDFIDKVKNKRVQGISFKQDGEKINLRNDDAPFKDASFWKTAESKKIKRFFEDLTEWFVDEVTSKVINVRFADGEVEVAVEPKKVVEVAKVEETLADEMPEVSEDDLDDQLGALLG